MSRIPQPRSPLKPPSTPAKSRVTAAGTPSRVRTQSAAKSVPPARSINAPINEESTPAPLSIKEAIALRRAEAKKAQTKGQINGPDDFISLEDALPTAPPKQDDEDILGRWPVRETIERARSTGNLNLATRSLPCIPSALFDIHLGITPDPLKSVPDEPVLPPTPAADTVPRRGAKRDAPAWFEARDLTILKAWNNDIAEIQHEISLFGSLKIVDLHKNKLLSLPTTFGDLTALTTLDLSHNSLTCLPTNLFALPELTTLNISHNSLTSLPFNAPFASTNNSSRPRQPTSGSFFTPAVVRAETPLPRLLNLDASYNKISANDIDLELPVNLSKVNLSSNPLGPDELRCRSLLQILSKLQKLRELRLEGSEIGNGAFPPGLFDPVPFPNLRILDLGQTKVTPETVVEALKGMKQELTLDVTTEDPPMGVTCVIVGKRVIKEAWELELERREKARTVKQTEVEEWDVLPATVTSKAPTTKTARPGPVKKPSVEVIKEAWEIEAEQGLLTEGGKRRARAAAAAASANSQSTLGIGAPSTPGHSPKSSTSGLSLSNPQYYSQSSQTLTLPPSNPPTKSPSHTRAFSLAAPTSSFSLSTSSRTTDIAVPPPTLPLSIIATQPFAHTLKILVLMNRRLDKSFSLLSLSDPPGGLLPNLEELNLEGCGLPDLVTVIRSDSSSGASTPPRSTEPILPLITKLFPSLRTLNLSYNALTSLSFTNEAISALILETGERKGLKHLRLRGNRLAELDGFQGIAESFKGNREVPAWKLDELDIRDNEVNKLPPELGLLPMDVFLVDGNTLVIQSSYLLAN
ncbi:hypothetical protein BDZ94DRAFT_1306115 [Collybia nuda]|uniref:Leucine-rich repeat-containing protein 40 n=1 Tax=Collybia nuda TaxID=64659 RepID=A0A9P5YDJ9_9AGAR|nr:hypothetical protein BDZ94DRAFT_1306115 [Collybia nuda]